MYQFVLKRLHIDKLFMRAYGPTATAAQLPSLLWIDGSLKNIISCPSGPTVVAVQLAALALEWLMDVYSQPRHT